ncbi:histidine phosphatase family protein [Tumidithrix helvetica]|uniref:histidine phosphatase family protein n=1 Tax=Tumidithrix helvetica TaxID=3457545 RepID=UPI003CC64A44
MTRIVLVRHGESTFNTNNMVQGRGNLDRPELQSVLTEKGQQQAGLAGAALASLHFDAAYVSPLLRARQTAEQILAASSSPPPVTFHEGLCEINLPAWEGLTFDEVRSQFPDQFHNWEHEPHKLVVSDRYPVLDLFEQAKAFWQETLPKHVGQTILIVGHSGVNRALISTVIGLKPAQYHHLQQINCAISVLNFAGDDLSNLGSDLSKVQVQMESLNLTSHLSSLTKAVLPPTRKVHIGPRILLVRHGETDWNRQKRFQGQIDVPLNAKGEEQAQQAADFLASVPIHKAFSSPMLRPKDTALKILTHHPDVDMEYFDELKEISHGLWEGKFEAEIEAEFAGELEKWQKTPEIVQMPEGENLQQVWDRVAEAWLQIIRATPAGETALVVAHDAVNKAILCQLFGFEPEKFWIFKQGNGGVSVIDYYKGYEHPPMLQAMNITTHLSNSVFDQTAAGAL